MPKCKNFHRTNFFYFFTIKPQWVGDLRAKIKKLKILIFRGSFGGFFFENFVLAQAECALKNFFFKLGQKYLVLMFTFELICMLLEGYLKIITLRGFFWDF